MYFKRLEMHGFKSFAEPVVIEFHQGITAIVGPNGSGKSNISDAIRWVLGEQSPKALRGGRMEEVIFAGTASRKSRGMAEVTLVIDNAAGILDIDYNEVAITRRMYRSGESEYLINNNHCRLKDIRELIMDTGIGVDGYSLIGQGKIADIVSNKPESRREIFEEAAGVVMYKSKKAEAERKLESTSGNLERVNDIIAEIESRIDGLREDSAKAKEYLQLKERYRDLEINITLKNIDSIQSKNETYRADISELTKQIQELTASKEAASRQVEEDRQRSENLEQLSNQARDKLMRTVEEINRLTSQSRLNEERLSRIDQDENRLSGEISVLADKLEKEEKNRSELEKSRMEILARHEEASAQLQDQILQHSRLAAETSELTESIDNEREQVYRLHNQAASKRSEAKSYESIIQALEKRKQQILTEAEEAEKSSADQSTQLKEAQTQQAEAVMQREQLQQEIQNLQKERAALASRQKDLSLEIEELKLSGGQKAARKKTIEEMEHNYEGYNYAVKYIMRAGFSGIRGVVAELMEVPSGYEVAVETALGAQMQNIVCDTDDAAKQAIQSLKQNRAGRLTFLPVSSVKGGRGRLDTALTADPGYRGLASDCVKFQPEYQNIFEYLLGRVAIVDTMDTAIRLSKRAGSGIRFVTLDGEIINASGAITGGKYRNKTANLLERRSEIAALEQEIETLRSGILQKSEENRKAAVRLEDIQRALAAKEEEHRSAELMAASLGSTVSALKEAVDSAAAGSQRFEKELHANDKEIADARQMIADLTAQAAEAEESILQAESRVEEAMSCCEEKKKALEEASEGITARRISVRDWESKKNNMETLLSRILEAIDDYSFQIQEKQKQIETMTAEKDRLIFGSDDARENTAALMEEKQTAEAYIQQIAEERAALAEKINTIAAEQQESLNTLNSCQDQKYQLEIKAARNDTQLNTLKERLWEDFEISYVQALDLRREDFVMSTSVKESREIRNRIRELGDVNVGAIKEYESVSQRYSFLTEQRRDITTAMEELRSIIGDMDQTIKRRFKENFDQVAVAFEEIFRQLFGGGHAQLSMEDEDNPLESGIDIIAQPPGKKLQNINLMSGGEKTMTAIALMFAVLKVKPTPFCILDEVEAALDDANIDRFAKYLRKFENIQFALVTHQKATMEHADVLYGVTMPEHGISKVLSLRLGDEFEL